MLQLIVNNAVDDWLLKSIKKPYTVSTFTPIHPFTKEKYIQTNLVWYLSSFKQIEYSGIEFFNYCPTDVLKNSLQEQDIIDAISNFDFSINYTAKEKDFFFIKEEYVYPDLKGKKRPTLFGQYMSFVFTNGQWISQVKNYDYLYEDLAKGFAEVI